MSINCSTTQDLCSIFRGDSLNFKFTFTDSEGNPLNIVNKTLFFTMKADPTSSDDAEENLQYYTTFPDDSDSLNGIGTMSIPASETQNLIPNMTYMFDFQLVDGSEVLTIGSGNVKVVQDITTTSQVP
jgi:hypothetical protein